MDVPQLDETVTADACMQDIPFNFKHVGVEHKVYHSTNACYRTQKVCLMTAIVIPKLVYLYPYASDFYNHIHLKLDLLRKYTLSKFNYLFN